MSKHNFFTDIREQAQAHHSVEVCGLLLFDHKGSLKIKPCANIHPEPEMNFEIPSKEAFPHMRDGSIFGYYHSHTAASDQGAAFTERDIAVSEASELPCLVYSLEKDEFNYYRPTTDRTPLFNRPFVVGLQDCFQFVADFYRKYEGVIFPFIERPYHMFITGYTRVRDYYTVLGFRRVPEPFQDRDLLLFSLTKDDRINHVGVFESPNSIVHHLVDTLAVRETLTGQLKQNLRAVLRRQKV